MEQVIEILGKSNKVSHKLSHKVFQYLFPDFSEHYIEQLLDMNHIDLYRILRK